MGVEWSVDPAVSLRADRVYNPNLARDNPVYENVGRLSVQAPLRMEEETRSLVITPRLSAQRYDRDKTLNGEDASVDLAAGVESETAVWRLNGNAARTSTWTSEWEDTGFVGARKWRITRALQPSVQWAATPLTTLSLSGNHSEVQYADARDTPLYGYNYSAANAGVTREFGERTNGGFSLYVTRMESPRIDNTSDDYGTQVSVSYEWHERWFTRLQVGGHRIHTRLAGVGDGQSGATTEASLTRAGERGQLGMTLSRSVSPSGFGVLVRRDQWTYSQTHALTEQIGMSVFLRLQQDESLIPARTDANRRAASMEWRLNYEWTPKWNGALGFDYALQRNDSGDEGAERAALLVQIGYHAGWLPLTTRANESMAE